MANVSIANVKILPKNHYFVSSLIAPCNTCDTPLNLTILLHQLKSPPHAIPTPKPLPPPNVPRSSRRNLESKYYTTATISLSLSLRRAWNQKVIEVRGLFFHRCQGFTELLHHALYLILYDVDERLERLKKRGYGCSERLKWLADGEGHVREDNPLRERR